MAKELFEDIQTGTQEYLFCWTSPYDNEKLKEFLQNSSIVDIEVNRIKLDSGFVINIEPNDYFRKTLDNRIELWAPKDMIKRFAYIGEVVAEEKNNLCVHDEEFKKKIYEKNPDMTEEEYTYIEQKWCDFKALILNNKPSDNIVDVKENLYKNVMFHKKMEEFVCGLEDEYNLSVTKSFWDELEKNTIFHEGNSVYDVAEVCSDFPFEKYIESEEKRKDVIYDIFKYFKQTDDWFNEQNKETALIFETSVYSEKDKGQIILRAQQYVDGRILGIDFTTDRAEYNPYY